MRVMKRGQVLAAVTIYVPSEIHQRAISRGINLSAAGRDGIMQALKEDDEQQKRDSSRLATDLSYPTA